MSVAPFAADVWKPEGGRSAKVFPLRRARAKDQNAYRERIRKHLKEESEVWIVEEWIPKGEQGLRPLDIKNGPTQRTKRVRAKGRPEWIPLSEDDQSNGDPSLARGRELAEPPRGDRQADRSAGQASQQPSYPDVEVAKPLYAEDHRVRGGRVFSERAEIQPLA